MKNDVLVCALHETADRLASGARYEWGHMGRCNCGHLVQTLTDMTDIEIAKAVEYHLDEWTEHAKDYCEGTGSRVQDLFDTLKDFGLSHQDMRHLEHLTDRRVLRRLGLRGDTLRKNDVSDVTLYMRTMAQVLADPV